MLTKTVSIAPESSQVLSLVLTDKPFSRPEICSWDYNRKRQLFWHENYCLGKKKEHFIKLNVIMLPDLKICVNRSSIKLTNLAGKGRSATAWDNVAIAACCCSVNGAFCIKKNWGRWEGWCTNKNSINSCFIKT